MRKVTLLPILVFLAWLTVPLAGALAWWIGLTPWCETLVGGAVLLSVSTGLCFLALTVLVYRVWLRYFPFPEGELAPGSRGEFRYLVYITFWLMIFLPVLRLGVIPVPLSRLVLKALGARVGAGSYSSGLVFDPHLVHIGAGTQLGIDCLVIPHAQAAGRLAHQRVHIGDGVTIGGRSIIMAGAVIEDGAVVGFCALVTQGTHIRAGEVWGGVPARRLRPGPPDPVAREEEGAPAALRGTASG